jgi:hypothetical protein
MEYQDFTVDLRSTESGDFEATVVAAPIRESPRVYFPRPIGARTLRDLHSAFDRPASEIVLSKETSPRKLGQRLSSALFRGELADLFLRCRYGIPADSTSGLRLRLRFEIGDPEAEYLAALPWEWLWDPRSDSFLATHLTTPVVRDLTAKQRPRDPLPVTPPLRILVVDAAPKAMKQLNLRLELECMTKALGFLIDAGQVELLKLKRSTPEELRDVLLDEDIHVVHFMGHGGYHSESGYGAVFFEKPDGTKDQVGGGMLGDYLERIPSLRVVVLNACQTARHAGRMGAPLYHGVASAVLSQTGVPAVVANQYSISDQAAITFSEAFYGRIAAGYAVDAALTEARLRLNARSPEWATPVLFLSSPDGKVFTMKSGRRKRTIRVVQVEPETVPVRLGVRSIIGWGRDMKERNDDVLELAQYFDGRLIKRKPWWQKKVFPDLRSFLRKSVDERRPLLLDFAAHSSIAFAAGWLLEPKSGLEVSVRQRTGGDGEFEWSPKDRREPEEGLWLRKRDIELSAKAPDVAVAISISQPNVAQEAQEFIERAGLRVGRIVNAVIAPAPGPQAVRGGAHAHHLAHALLYRLQQRRPHEREGRIHLFCAAPNAFVFYLGQLASSLPGVVLYEYPYGAKDAYGRYQKSIELPPLGEAATVPKRW